MKNFLKVFKFTYSQSIKNKAFIISTIIVLLLMGVVFNINKIMSIFNGDNKKTFENTIVVTTNSNLKLNDKIIKNESNDGTCFIIEDNKEKVQNIMKEMALGKSKYEGILEIKNIEENKGTLYVNKMLAGSDINKVKQLVKNIRLSNGILTEKQYKQVVKPVDLNIVQNGNSSEKRIVIVYVLIMAIYIITLMYGSMVANSVIEEKSNRIMETLITMAKPIQLFFGKVLGICAVGLTQIGAFLIFGFIGLKKSNLAPDLRLSMSFKIIVAFIFYFLLAYLMMAMLYAAVASLGTSLQDVNSSMTPITMVFVVIFLVAINCMQNIDSTFARVLSYVPFASPLIMFERIILSSVGVMEIIINIAENIIFIMLIGIFSSKLYKKGTLMYGGKISLLKLFKKTE
ncbi:ABC transporter permease [Clostridium botulinum]|uniref:Sodium ABC transporter permease n=2 Tax=Clostridium botulinum TaxID=1491 RepID=A0A9Q1UX38_CLOBO|nr:ABC transporter permease [Clostridium botulinum]KEI04855.1 sodium ABC transporter permease [Clostridium botulinum C/D str. Sp77]KLU75932.1 sodium ABC transporter permease [Clostridium botulinum V891]KOA75626.1 sodium ABC transporter permease [Clostridium botulinum]KOA76783.1 sodium ABC transporter permease [Clostridium botulinum]KOA82841.1 sodium ABC transporter permease [Clostridium botulinum]